ATYENAIQHLDKERDQQIFSRCVDTIRHQMERRNSNDDVMDLSVIRYFSYNWMQMDNPDVVENVFRRFFNPLLRKLYEGGIPSEDLSVFREFHEYATLYSRRRMTDQAEELRRELVEKGMLAASDTRPLAVVACEYILAAGVDHVLVGMRAKEYA